MATPLVGQLAHQLVDLALGADVDAARRLVEDHQLRPHRQPLGQHHLLLVAARQRARLGVSTDGALMPSRARCARRSALSAAPCRSGPAGIAPAGPASVMFSRDRHVEHQARRACGPPAPGRCRARWRRAASAIAVGSPSSRTSPPSSGSMPKTRAGERGAAGADQPGQARGSRRGAPSRRHRCGPGRRSCARPRSRSRRAGVRPRAGCRATSDRARSSAGSSRRGVISSLAERRRPAARRAGRPRGRRMRRSRPGGG